MIGSQHSLQHVSDVPISYAEYIERIKSMKYIFANDYLNSRESIIMGRAFEALALENVVSHERGSKLSLF